MSGGFNNPPDDAVGALLNGARVIALVGASANPKRASHEVMAFLQSKGHRVIPVNPGLAGQTLLGETVMGALGEIHAPIDMVDVFRSSEHVSGVVDEAIAVKAKAIWTQLDVWDEDAARRAQRAGLFVVMDRCPKIEYHRLHLRGPIHKPD